MTCLEKKAVKGVVGGGGGGGIWAGALVLSFCSCVAQDSCSNLSEPQLPHL